MTILITGSSGMIGSQVAKAVLQQGHSVIGVDLAPAVVQDARYTHYELDLSDTEGLDRIFEQHPIDRVIHLAALAHENGKVEYSWENLRRINYEYAGNVFAAAAARKCPILFSSTVDVYGYEKGTVGPDVKIRPASMYGVSKAMAERELKKVCRQYHSVWTIYRFAPVYTPEIKRDIQKRYYLSYPNIAYVIGEGSYYEVLCIDKLIGSILEWLEHPPVREIRNIRDDELLDTKQYIREEKKAGRAKIVLHIPRGPLLLLYSLLYPLLKKRPEMYLLHKALYPYRSEDEAAGGRESGENKNIGGNAALKDLDKAGAPAEEKQSEARSKDNREAGAQDTKNAARPKVLFISSTGGHYEQLKMLKPSMAKYDSKVITEKSVATSGADYYLLQISHTDKLIVFKFLYDMVGATRIWIKERPDYIVSTGSMIFIPFAILAKLTHKKIIYIETFAVRENPTLTGKFMYGKADLFIVQWETLKKAFPDAVYGGSIY